MPINSNSPIKQRQQTIARQITIKILCLINLKINVSHIIKHEAISRKLFWNYATPTFSGYKKIAGKKEEYSEVIKTNLSRI